MLDTLIEKNISNDIKFAIIKKSNESIDLNITFEELKNKNMNGRNELVEKSDKTFDYFFYDDIISIVYSIYTKEKNKYYKQNFFISIYMFLGYDTNEQNKNIYTNYKYRNELKKNIQH